MGEPLELTIAVKDGGGPPANLQRTEEQVRRLDSSFDLTNRSARRLTGEGLNQLAQVAPGLVGVMGEIANASETAARALNLLGKASVVLLAFETAKSVGEALREWGIFGESLEKALEKLQRAQEQERVRLAARGALQQLNLQYTKDQITAAAAAEAAILRGEGLAVQAIARESDARRQALKIQQDQEQAELRKTALTPEGRVNFGREQENLRRKQLADTAALEADIATKEREARNQETTQETQRQQLLREAAAARAAAEADMQQAVLAGEAALFQATGDQLNKRKAALEDVYAFWRAAEADTIDAAQRASNGRVAAIQAETTKQIEEWQKQVATREIQEDVYNQLRRDLEAKTNASILAERTKTATAIAQIQDQAREKEKAELRQRLTDELDMAGRLKAAADAATQERLTTAQQILQNEGRTAEAARLATEQRLGQIRAEAEAEIATWQREVALKKMSVEEFETFRQLQNQRTQAKILAALEQERQARRQILMDAAAAEQRSGGGKPGAPSFLQNLKGMDDLKQDSERVTQGYAQLIAQGVPFSELSQAINQQGKVFQERYRELEKLFKDSPTILRQLQDSLGYLGRNDLDVHVLDAVQRIKDIPSAAAGGDQALDQFSKRLLDTLSPAVDAANQRMAALNENMKDFAAWCEYAMGKLNALAGAI
jgi:hypothetical protein